jgi:hypothetical protein
VLSVLLRFTDSDYPFCIVKLFLNTILIQLVWRTMWAIVITLHPSLKAVSYENFWYSFTIQTNNQIYCYLLYPRSTGGEVYCFTSVHPSVRPKIFFVTFFSATINGRNLIFGHKLHIGTPYCGKHFWTRHIPTSCLWGYHKWAVARSSSCYASATEPEVH